MVNCLIYLTYSQAIGGASKYELYCVKQARCFDTAPQCES